MKNHVSLPPVVILDITYSGYGAMRSLYPYNIPIYGFTFDENHTETKSKLAKEIIIYSNDGNDLLEKLVSLAKRCKGKPVLILTNDAKVEFALANLDIIQTHFHLNIPTPAITEMLIDKIKLMDFINLHDIKIPKSLSIEAYADIKDIANFKFPVILKPYVKSEKWYNAGLSKAFIFDNRVDLLNMFPILYNIENRLVIQEFIPGGDSDIYYCLVYYGKDAKCKAAFSGQKIRQWKILKGSTASTRSTDIPYIEEETKRIFDLAGFKGFGSIEFKKNPQTGEFYMIEPTAGRIDFQEYIATFSGVNIPLIGYCDQTGITIIPKEKIRSNTVYIDEIFELESAKEYNRLYGLTFGEWLKSVKGRKCFRYMNLTDHSIAIKIGLLLTRRLAGLFVRSLIGKKPQEPADQVEY
ncbi:MAG: hypothetical protein JEZ14_06965 [Marinilabiliaceae bacterium]|nr:hypothetical protein [Marinilabiliaceae bacterium]